MSKPAIFSQFNHIYVIHFTYVQIFQFTCQISILCSKYQKQIFALILTCLLRLKDELQCNPLQSTLFLRCVCKAFYLLSDYICTLCSKYPEHFFCLYTNLSTPVRRLTPMQSSPKYRAEGPGSGNITREITMQNYAKLRCRVTFLGQG